MNRNYAQLFAQIHSNKGEWLEVESDQLTGSTVIARQKALCRAAKQRRCAIQTRLRADKLTVRLAHEGKMSDVLARVEKRRPMNKRVPLKRIYGPNWFRVKDDKASCAPNMRVVCWRGSLYLLCPDVELPPELQKLVSLVNIYTAITSRNQYFLLYIFMNGGRWCRSAVAAAGAAMSAWVKVEKNFSANYVAVGGCIRTSQPEWGKLPPFDALLASAFKNRIINSVSNSVVQQMLGFDTVEIILS
jgi:hypothetical protein